MAEFNLIKISGEPLEKLIDVISSAIGTAYKPRAIRKEAEAEAYRTEVIERAKAKALAEGKEIETDSYIRTQDRLLCQEMKRQQNIDKVSLVAIEQLSQEQTVSKEPVDDDWATRFFNIVKDISDEEMQRLWGRILAGEVKQPKSYSLRTLELLKNISRQEAEIFIKAANFVISSDDTNFIFKWEDDKLNKKFNLHFSDFAKLIEIGLLQPSDLIHYMLNQVAEDTTISFISNSIVIIVNKKANTPLINIPVYLFTNSGNEILKLISRDHQLDYLTIFAKFIKQNNVTVKYGQVLERNAEIIRHTMPLLDFLE